MTGKASRGRAPTGRDLPLAPISSFFTDAFASEDDAALALKDFDILLTMRERTPFPESLIRRLPKLRMIGITGASNRSLDVEA
jgi:phosphoglycerate dehydrogenase-like enzyme